MRTRVNRNIACPEMDELSSGSQTTRAKISRGKSLSNIRSFHPYHSRAFSYGGESKVINQFHPNIENNLTNPISQSLIVDNIHQPRPFSFSPEKMGNKSKLLPPRNSKNLKRKTLVLDLDETLVHSGFSQYNPNIPSDLILPIQFENQKRDIHVLIRPGVKEFLARMSKRFEIIIFTASLSSYADPLISVLDQEKVCEFRLFREHCTFVNGAFIKDLKRLNRSLKDIILLDNSPIAYALNVDNGLPIKTWYDDRGDRELYNIAPIIDFLSYVEDVRYFIPRLVIDGEVSLGKAMTIISDYNEKLKSEQQKQEEGKREINIKIVNNNYNSYIYNKNEKEENKQYRFIDIHNDNNFTANSSHSKSKTTTKSTTNNSANQSFRGNYSKGKNPQNQTSATKKTHKGNNKNLKKIPMPKTSRHVQNNLFVNQHKKVITNGLSLSNRPSSAGRQKSKTKISSKISIYQNNQVVKKNSFIKRTISTGKGKINHVPQTNKYAHNRNISYDYLCIKQPMTTRSKSSGKIIFNKGKQKLVKLPNGYINLKNINQCNIKSKNIVNQSVSHSKNKSYCFSNKNEGNDIVSFSQGIISNK